MSIKINYSKNSISKSTGNLVLFSDEKFSVNSLKKYLSNLEFSYINDLLKTSDLKKNLFIFEVSSKKKIVLISIKKDLKSFDIENLGAEFYGRVNYGKNSEYFINTDSIISKHKNFTGHFLHGLKLKSYEFNKYKSKKETRHISLNVLGNKNKPSVQNQLKFKALEEGTFYARDLVSEPGNILHPNEYAKRLNNLKKDGLKITIYDEKKLKKMGMNALLGVGMGSIRGSFLVTMEWNGAKNNSKPLAFVGKGVTFDTGGYSLKPARFMEDMTYDMAGSAAVVGLMKNLALRKATVNAVGVVGLVENMVSGDAQRPGDIVKSYSGKTIEVLNTDAEGRLVLADALTFTEKKFKPKFMIDLATLTGAIIVSLGSEYAGLFSNDDKLSKQILNAGEKVEEKLWRMPLHKNYDKLMNSKNADMQNINYVGGAGSTTAAQFLQRFILNKTPWAHLDIAGMAFSKYGGALNSGGATGFGVRLLNELIEENYE
ncbi:leucyl aminopeptidase [Pelagibacteraceae bacterium]|jgi:leucyl aminopeptidase|nr:leucyl aminopeptidase [Pelagibacteraceae bacterium]MDC0952688.1 leucyl aminopeptidase [Pelagibacteraceae bacterium]